jgi:Rod binding domain-containing protein
MNAPAISSSATVVGSAGARDRTAEHVYRAAQEFEGLLLGSLLRSLQETFSGVGEADSTGNDQYQYMGVMSLANVLAKAGGLGLAEPIVRQLLGTKGGGSTPVQRFSSQASPATALK